MPKIIIDIKCNKCGYQEEIWASQEEREAIGNGERMCHVCKEPPAGEMRILLGTPQFKLNRGCGGFYDPGKH